MTSFCWQRCQPIIQWWRTTMENFPRYWPFVRGSHRSPVSYPRNGQWRGALIFSLICAWINGWVKNREAGDLMRHRAHYDVTVMHCDLRENRRWFANHRQSRYVSIDTMMIIPKSFIIKLIYQLKQDHPQNLNARMYMLPAIFSS